MRSFVLPQHTVLLNPKVLNIRNTLNVFYKSVAYMKQILLERQGYSERIENMFGKGMINEDVGICFLHISRHLYF